MPSPNWTFEVTTLDKALTYIDFTKLVLCRESEMASMIYEPCTQPKFFNIMVMIAYFKGFPAGWAWVFSQECRENSSLRQLSFMVFVQSKYRRRGVGSELMKWGKSVARRRHQRLIVFPWDYRSEEFYDNNKIKYENQREVMW